jgi:hypothetical protein
MGTGLKECCYYVPESRKRVIKMVTKPVKGRPVDLFGKDLHVLLRSVQKEHLELELEERADLGKKLEEKISLASKVGRDVVKVCEYADFLELSPEAHKKRGRDNLQQFIGSYVHTIYFGLECDGDSKSRLNDLNGILASIAIPQLRETRDGRKQLDDLIKGLRISARNGIKANLTLLNEARGIAKELRSEDKIRSIDEDIESAQELDKELKAKTKDKA